MPTEKNSNQYRCQPRFFCNDRGFFLMNRDLIKETAINRGLLHRGHNLPRYAQTRSRLLLPLKTAVSEELDMFKMNCGISSRHFSRFYILRKPSYKPRSLDTFERLDQSNRDNRSPNLGFSMPSFFIICYLGFDRWKRGSIKQCFL